MFLFYQYLSVYYKMESIMKTCNTCIISKTLDCYTTNKRYKYGKENRCKDCTKIYLSGSKDKIAESQRKWREKNPDYMKEYGKSDKCKVYHANYYIENSQKYKDRKKQWRIDNPERETLTRKNYVSINRQKNNSYHREWKSNQRQDNINYKLKENTSRRIRYELCRILSGKKTKRTTEYLGCTIEELKVHLETKFVGDMSWNNYGTTWHIDHIIPCAAWNLQDTFESNCCWNFRNLQPLPSSENQKKKDKYDEKDKNAYIDIMKSLIT
jgi:hypothetical protein